MFQLVPFVCSAWYPLCKSVRFGQDVPIRFRSFQALEFLETWCSNLFQLVARLAWPFSRFGWLWLVDQWTWLQKCEMKEMSLVMTRGEKLNNRYDRILELCGTIYSNLAIIFTSGKLTYKLLYAFGATTYISHFSVESWEHS